MKNFYTSVDEMKKDLEPQKKQFVNEYEEDLRVCKKTQKAKSYKKMIKITILIAFGVAIIKIFFGTIELYNVFGAPPSKARYYKVTVNNKQIAVSYNLRHKIPIIPFLVNFNSYYLGGSHIEDNDTGPFFFEDGSKKYIIDISSYSCFTGEYQTECTSNMQKMKENNDTEYTNLTITRITNPREELYNGKFIKDIAPYVKKKGEYLIAITAKHGLTETTVHFYFDN